MRLTPKPWRDVPICVGIVVVLFPIFWPAPACGCSKIAVGLANVRRQARGILEYSGDHDDRYPDRDLWTDGIAPYLESSRAYPDRDVPKGSYGYAFNGALSRGRAPDDAATTPMVYDSVNPIRNVSDLVTSLPNPGRHHGYDEEAMADGHARGVRVGSAP